MFDAVSHTISLFVVDGSLQRGGGSCAAHVYVDYETAQFHIDEWKHHFSTVHLNATSHTALSPSERRIICAVASCVSLTSRTPLGYSVKCQRLRFRGTSSSKCPNVYFLYLRSNVPPLICGFCFFPTRTIMSKSFPAQKMLSKHYPRKHANMQPGKRAVPQSNVAQNYCINK